MKKGIYLWIFLAVALIVCGMLYMVLKSSFLEERSTNPFVGAKKEVVQENDEDKEEMKIDLTQENIDFEEDVDDLSDNFIDDSQFDEEINIESIENEVY